MANVPVDEMDLASELLEETEPGSFQQTHNPQQRLTRLLTLKTAGIGVGNSAFLQSGVIPFPFTVKSVQVYTDTVSPNITAQFGYTISAVTDEESKANAVNFFMPYGFSGAITDPSSLPMTAQTESLGGLNIRVPDRNCRLWCRFVNGSATANIVCTCLFVIERGEED